MERDWGGRRRLEEAEAASAGGSKWRPLEEGPRGSPSEGALASALCCDAEMGRGRAAGGGVSQWACDENEQMAKKLLGFGGCRFTPATSAP